MDSYMREIIDYAERMTRARISEWPDGRYSFRDHIDDDGLSDEPIPIAVTLDVAGDHVTIDFAGSSPQVKAAINSTLSYTNRSEERRVGKECVITCRYRWSP